MSTWSPEEGSESSQNKINLHLKVLLLQICLDNSQTWILVLIFHPFRLQANYFQENSESFIPCNEVCSTFLNWNYHSLTTKLTVEKAADILNIDPVGQWDKQTYKWNRENHRTNQRNGESLNST